MQNKFFYIKIICRFVKEIRTEKTTNLIYNDFK
jgi:hypothetical protein